MKMLIPNETARRLSSRLNNDFFSEFDHLMDNFLKPYRFSEEVSAGFDWTETSDHYLASFDMPGIKKENIKIEVKDGTLSVEGERKSHFASDETEATHRSYKYGKFQRSFQLPKNANAEKIEAHYEDGVLELAIPKSEESKSKTISIQEGKGGLLNRFLGKKVESK